MSDLATISSYDSHCPANLPSAEAAPARACDRVSFSDSMTDGIALRIASRSSAIHPNERYRGNIWLRLTLFSKLAKCRGGSRSDAGILTTEKLKDGLNGDVKSVTKLRYPFNERC